MKWVLTAMLVLLTLSLLGISASAEGLEDALGVNEVEEALPQSAGEVLGDWSGADGAQTGLEKIINYAKRSLFDILRGLLRPVLTIIAIALICSSAETILPKKSGFDYINLGGCIAAAMVGVSDVNSVISLGRLTMAEMTDFSHALLPTVCAAATAAGAVSSAPVKYAATVMFLDVLTSAAESIIFPLVCAYTAAVLADAALGDSRLKGAVKLLRWACRFTLGALVTAFTVYLGLTGIIASSTDALATKAAKTAISAALPVVGGMISDAAGSIVAGAGLIRSTIGVFGLIAVLAVCVAPFLKLGLRYLLFKAAAAISEMTAGGRISRLLDGLADACGMVLGMTGVQTVFLFMSVIAMIKAVGG